MVKSVPPVDEFLVSFLVDARGGYMQAQRMPQMKIFVPPDAAPAPTRIICHLLRPDSVVNLPGMNDCDGFASRILQIHSSCPRFQKPILIEMPHIALLKNGDREIVIMKKHADSENWKEHSTTFTDESLKNEYGNLYESITPFDQLESSRICRIITTDVPNYFSLISRFRRDVNMIGPDGGFIESKADKRIKLTFPQGALMKKIQISLEVQNVDPGIVNHIVGDNHNISMSPIITVEPKRRKFRDMIDIQMGLPKGVTKNDLEHLKLLFSISEYTTKWEDVTSATELLTTDNNCIAHATKISARVWMIYAPDVVDVSELANKIYALHCPTPYVGKFLAYARRHEQEECQIRCILITDDTAEKTLECQENFQLIATGPEVEVVNKLQYQIECAGNIVAVTKSGESILFPVQSFFENRITLPIRVRNPDESFIGKIAFIPHFQSVSKQITKPVTTLEIVVPDIIVDMVGSVRNPEHKNRVKNAAIERIKGCQMIAKTELDLKSVADGVGADWHNLADELGLEADDINLVLNENCTDEEKAFMTLIVWQNSFGKKATGNELNRALRKIGREDVVKTCMGDISFVENEDEVKSAMEQLNDEEKRNHDECWDDIISTKNKPDAYNESVDESMIVETGDDWSQSHRESKLSDISDDKSLVLESTQDSEHEIHNEIKPIVDPTKTVSTVERTASEKTAAFLLLVDQLDEVLPAPVIENPEIDKAYKVEVCEDAVVKSIHKNKQVENVDKSISLLNLINCQINNDFVNVDTVIDLDDLFPEPQEIDVETFSQVDLNEFGDNRDQNEYVLEVCIPEDKIDSLINNYSGCEITNTLMNMKNDETAKTSDSVTQNETLKHRRYTIDKARLLQHNDTFHFHPPVSSLRRCFSVDSRHGRGIFSFCNQINSLHEESILEKGDWPSDEDLKFIHGNKHENKYPEFSVGVELSKEDLTSNAKIQNELSSDNKTPEIENKDYLLNFVRDSPVTDLDDLSLSDELEKPNNQKEVDEQYIVAMPSMSAVPSHLNYDLDSILNESITPQRAGNLHAQPMVSDSSMGEYRKFENEYDTDDNKEEIIPLYENSEKTNNQTEVLGSSVPSFYDSSPLEQVNFTNETVINVDEIKSECIENDEETIKVDKISLSEETKQFEETDSHVNVVENDEEVNKFDENTFVSKDIPFESLATTETHQDDTIAETEHEHFVNDEKVSKFEENSFVKEVVKDESSIPAETHLDDSTIITESDNIEKYESPSLNVKSTWEGREINETDNTIDNEIIHQIEENSFSNEPVESWSDLQSEEVNLQSDNNEVQPNNSIIDNNEGLNKSEKHSILHEVIESDPQIQTEIEEEVEVLPDGTIVNRKITKRQISQIITEKITRDIDPDDEESFPTTQFIENPAEVIETEEILPDGTILKRTISTSKKTITTTSKIVTEKEIAKDENIADSSFTSKEPSEAPIENVSANPPAKQRKNKNKKKGNKK